MKSAVENLPEKTSNNVQTPKVTQEPPSSEASSEDEAADEIDDNSLRSRSQSIQMAKSKYGSKGALHSPVGSAHSFDLQVRNCCDI